MISTLHSQVFGFGYPLTFPYIQTINENFYLHPKYVDTDTENTIMVPTHKEPTIMGMNPFCQEFEYGEIAEGYWTHDRELQRNT